MEEEKDCLAKVDFETKLWFTKWGRLRAENGLSIFNFGGYVAEEPIVMPYDFKEAGKELGLMWNIMGGGKQQVFPILNINEEAFFRFFNVDPKRSEIMYLGPVQGWQPKYLPFPYYPVDIDKTRDNDTFLLHGLIAEPFLCGWPVSFVFQVGSLYEEDGVIRPSFFFAEDLDWEVFIRTPNDGSVTKEIIRESS